MSAFEQLGLQRSVVLDDAVVDDGQFLPVGHMRVGVAGIGFAVGVAQQV